MAFFTKPFGYYYKHFPSTSYYNTPLANGAFTNNISFNWTDGVIGWYKSSSFVSGFGSTTVSQSFFNFPVDSGLFEVYRPLNQVGSVSGSYRALPWGSAASDFLWNIQTTQWSFYEPTFGIASDSFGYWYAVYNSESFFEKYYPGASGSLGSQRYNITSSWVAYDPKLYPRSDGNENFQLFRSPSPPPANYYEDYVVVSTPDYPNQYSGPSGSGAFDNGAYTAVSYRLGRSSGSSGTGNYVESSSIDLRPFYYAGGAAITRTDVSSSLEAATLYGSATSGTNLRLFRTALKNRRLFFPTPVSASGTTKSQDYWLKTLTGFQANQVFTENGGIYQVDFTIKRDLTNNMYPDTGSFLSVFISDCKTEAPLPANRAAGVSGWYPPDSNIVRIYNGSSTSNTMDFIDPETGYLHQKFSVTLVQYGVPAHLCFEASGSRTNNTYFGCIIDDISFCKVGVTTDPNFIKPSGGGGTNPALDPRTEDR